MKNKKFQFVVTNSNGCAIYHSPEYIVDYSVGDEACSVIRNYLIEFATMNDWICFGDSIKVVYLGEVE